MSNVVDNINPVKSSFWKNFLIVAVVLIVMFLIYVIFFMPRISMKKIKELVAIESKKYSDPATVESLLLQGSKEIVSSPNALKQAKIYAKSSGIEIERVIVDNAISMAKQNKFIG